MSASSTTTNNLTHRRQFFLGPEVPDLVAGWNHHPAGQEFSLSVHPDLSCTRAQHGASTLILLGYVLDPRHPERGDQTILDDVLRASPTFEEVLRAFDPLVGRWAAIYLNADHVLAFHDATGSRQIYHCQDDNGTVRLGSSAGLLSRITGRPVDTETLHDLEREHVFRPGFTFFWPGSGSSFVGIHRLLPNHYLDAGSGVVQRFWPAAPIRQMDPLDAAALSKTTLGGAISAAHSRWPLALSLTAGFDSRLLLAAARPIAGDLAFYSYKKPGMNSFSPDVRVPHKILSDLGYQHQVITVKPASDGPVMDAISASVHPVHQTTASQAAALLASPPRTGGSWVTLNGNVAELAQVRLRRRPVTPENLALNARMPDSMTAMKLLEEWHTRATPAINASGVDPWDLLYWEQKLGGWFATVRTEFDVVEDAVTPYNSRSWIEGMLGVDPSLRGAPELSFFRGLIGDLWPELLDYPFNPADAVGDFARRSRSAARSVVRFATESSRRPRTK